jgi:hypothetical protein
VRERTVTGLDAGYWMLADVSPTTSIEYPESSF